MRTNRKRTCRGKVRFRDHTEAVRSLHMIASRGERSGRNGVIPVRAYECPRCGGFHVTSRP